MSKNMWKYYRCNNHIFEIKRNIACIHPAFPCIRSVKQNKFSYYSIILTVTHTLTLPVSPDWLPAPACHHWNSFIPKFEA